MAHLGEKNENKYLCSASWMYQVFRFPWVCGTVTSELDWDLRTLSDDKQQQIPLSTERFYMHRPGSPPVYPQDNTHM